MEPLHLSRLDSQSRDADYRCAACRHVIRFGQMYVQFGSHRYHRGCRRLRGKKKEK